MAMIRILCAATAVLAMAAGPALAQTVPGKPPRGGGGGQAPGAGQTIRGELTSSDPELDDGSFYDCHPLNLVGEQRYGFRMEASAFDAYLALMAGANCNGAVVDSDDDGAGGTNALIEFTAPSSGRWSLRANSLSEGETGAYTLTIAGAAATPAPQPMSVRTLRLNEVAEGRLESSDAEAADGSYFDCWRLEPNISGDVDIVLQSEDFDAYLSIYANATCDGEYIGSDDDSAGGTDAGLTGQLERGRIYSVRANSLSAGETGEYGLLAVRAE
jgi:hypothetical protein